MGSGRCRGPWHEDEVEGSGLAECAANLEDPRPAGSGGNGQAGSERLWAAVVVLSKDPAVGVARAQYWIGARGEGSGFGEEGLGGIRQSEEKDLVRGEIERQSDADGKGWASEGVGDGDRPGQL